MVARIGIGKDQKDIDKALCLRQHGELIIGMIVMLSFRRTPGR